jgi:hypothetical protein
MRTFATSPDDTVPDLLAYLEQINNAILAMQISNFTRVVVSSVGTCIAEARFSYDLQQRRALAARQSEKGPGL